MGTISFLLKFCLQHAHSQSVSADQKLWAKPPFCLSLAKTPTNPVIAGDANSSKILIKETAFQQLRNKIPSNCLIQNVPGDGRCLFQHFPGACNPAEVDLSRIHSFGKWWLTTCLQAVPRLIVSTTTRTLLPTRKLCSNRVFVQLPFNARDHLDVVLPKPQTCAAAAEPLESQRIDEDSSEAPATAGPDCLKLLCIDVYS